MTTTNLIEMRGVSRTFDSSPPVEAVRSTDFDVKRGEYISVVGPSGSGKSTLLSIIGCLDRPTAGTYRLDGVDVGSLSDGRRAGLRGSVIGFVFQTFHLLPHRAVTENVMTGMLYNRTPRPIRGKRAAKAIDRVGLSHRADFLPTKLSGGEQQRVAIARALAGQPSLLLCDEPTGNLDTETSGAILDIFDELHDDGLTIIVITHDQDVSRRASRSIELVDGQIVNAT